MSDVLDTVLCRVAVSVCGSILACSPYLGRLVTM